MSARDKIRQFEEMSTDAKDTYVCISFESRRNDVKLEKRKSLKIPSAIHLFHLKSNRVCSHNLKKGGGVHPFGENADREFESRKESMQNLESNPVTGHVLPWTEERIPLGAT